MPRKPEYDRDALIERARDVFWSQGWAGTSLKDLEGALNMRPGSFYAAFGSKDALFGLALDKYAKDAATRLRALAAKHGPLEALKMHPQAVLSTTHIGAKACMLAKTVLELQARNHPLAQQAGQHLKQLELLFTDLFDQAQKQQKISGNQSPARLARRYQSDLLGLRMSAEREDFDAAELADEISLSLNLL